MSKSSPNIKAIIFDCDGVIDLGGLNRDIVPIIQRLHTRFRLGVLSNTDRAPLHRFLGEHDLNQYFDVVLASGQTRFVKPQREIFEIMSERLDVPFAHTLFIDDSPLNISTAAGYGIHAILFDSVPVLQTQLATYVS